MDVTELTPQIEELKRVLNGIIDEDQILKELNTYINTYHITVESAMRGIKRKYNVGEPATFVSGDSVNKKISDLLGTEMNIDITAKVVYVDKKNIVVRGSDKTIVTGIIGDDSGTVSFTIWEGADVDLIKGEVYIFKNAYTKKWKDRVQVNLSTRGKVEPAEGVSIDVQDRVISMEASEMKIGDIKEGVGNVTVTGRILSVEPRNITVKGEAKVVYGGLIADDSGKIQFSAWDDYNLKEGESICVKNAYIRAWRGIPQLNIGDKCEISRVDDSFGEIVDTVAEKTIADIIKIGGALDVSVTGVVVDLRGGSGLIKRCPECNRSVLNDECTAHGRIEPVFDLRMKLTIDDGTGAINAILNRADTEKLTGITLAAAEGLAKARGDSDIVARDMAEMIIMKKITVTGNVMSDDYGPMMIVSNAEAGKTDIKAEAEKLFAELEDAL